MHPCKTCYSLLIDGHDDKVLLEDVDALGPALDPVVALLRRRQVGVVLDGVHAVAHGLGPRGQPVVEERGEDVRAVAVALAHQVELQTKGDIFILLKSRDVS